MKKKLILSKYLDSVLRDFANKGASEILDEDMKDLLLFGFVSRKLRGEWLLTNEGAEYLKVNPYYVIPLRFNNTRDNFIS